MINERAARDKWASCSVFFGLLLFRSQKRVICQIFLKLKSYFLVHFYSFFVSFLKNRAIRSFPLFYVMSDVSQSLRSLTKNERYEWIAQVAHQKWANEQIDYVAHQKWANCSVYFYRITHLLIIRSFFFAKNERFAQKTDEWSPNPGWVLSCGTKGQTLEVHIRVSFGGTANSVLNQ